MSVDANAYHRLKAELDAQGVTLLAVSKTKPKEDIEALYQLGHRDFAENYVQELVEKQPLLPGDIRWHFIGHLQRNKVKYIASFCAMIQGVDSLSLLQEINKQAQKCGRVIDVLLQVHIASEETKFGLGNDEVFALLEQASLYPNVQIKGLMGMASFTDNTEQVRQEFLTLKSIFDRVNSQGPHNRLTVLSMGMSGDYRLAITCGSTMVRVGSLLFGARS
ncbi:MAG: YggS family pyridoxal phosphate-dependent enzyme [Chitinophagales bacterium]|jgi:pyridoxal phosphate enzyme (YggS family)|nr:YggS family pyridoxal phosphate-dependent enzyme [Chitinophagales bacterium]